MDCDPLSRPFCAVFSDSDGDLVSGHLSDSDEDLIFENENPYMDRIYFYQRETD